jgi:hypothetical protein
MKGFGSSQSFRFPATIRTCLIVLLTLMGFTFDMSCATRHHLLLQQQRQTAAAAAAQLQESILRHVENVVVDIPQSNTLTVAAADARRKPAFIVRTTKPDDDTAVGSGRSIMPRRCLLTKAQQRVLDDSQKQKATNHAISFFTLLESLRPTLGPKRKEAAVFR